MNKRRLIAIITPAIILLFSTGVFAQKSAPKKVDKKVEKTMDVVPAVEVKEGEEIIEVKEEVAGKEKPAGNALGKADRPEYVLVDGKEFDPDKLNEISPDKIAKVEVLKGKKAKELNEKYKKGVIVITLKKE